MDIFSHNFGPDGIVTSLDGEGTLSIWSISRLRVLAASLTRRTVRVADIGDLDRDLWFNNFDIPTCREIAKHAKRICEADYAYPILLDPEGRVIDGMHRISKAWLLGVAELSALQFDEMPIPDKIVENFISYK